MKRVYRWLYNLNIQGKLTGLFVLVVLIPVIALSVYSHSTSRAQLLSQAYENLNAIGDQVNNSLSSRLDMIDQLSGVIFSDAGLNEYLVTTYQRDYDFVEAYYYIDQMMYSLLTMNGYIDGITLYVDNDTLPSDGKFVKPLSQAPFEAGVVAKAMRPGNAALYAQSGLTVSKEPALVFVRALNYSLINQPYGVMAITVPEAELYGLIKQSGGQRRVYVLDEKDRVLIAREQAQLNQPAASFLGEALPRGSGQLQRRINGTQLLLVYREMHNGWRSLLMIPYADVLAPARQATGRLALFALLALGLGILLVAVVSRHFARRFQRVSQQIQRVSDEDFTCELPPMGEDELGQIAHAFNQLVKKLNTLINELYKKELLKKEAELYALQSQINPHFLYNTLSAISSLSTINHVPQVGQLVQHLSRFYQISLNKGRRYITVAQELDITRHYLAIQHCRFREMFQEHWEVDEQVYPLIILKLLLQPFVENAIDHALFDESHVLNIWLRGGLREGALWLEVEDDGVGMTQEKADRLVSRTPELGYGIYNVHERIRLSFGEEYGVQVYSQPGLGTKVCMRLPADFHPSGLEIGLAGSEEMKG